MAAVTAIDVAAYILKKHGSMTHWKLQKLLYYSQAWSLVWDDAALFRDRIEAWANGPVIPTVFRPLKTLFTVRKSDLTQGNANKLSHEQKKTVDSVLAFYGDKSSQWLRDLTHMEDPWRNARNNAPAGSIGTNEIKIADMATYYGSL